MPSADTPRCSRRSPEPAGHHGRRDRRGRAALATSWRGSPLAAAIAATITAIAAITAITAIATTARGSCLARFTAIARLACLTRLAAFGTCACRFRGRRLAAACRGVRVLAFATAPFRRRSAEPRPPSATAATATAIAALAPIFGRLDRRARRARAQALRCPRRGRASVVRRRAGSAPEKMLFPRRRSRVPQVAAGARPRAARHRTHRPGSGFGAATGAGVSGRMPLMTGSCLACLFRAA
jgi:hypothetical protein